MSLPVEEGIEDLIHKAISGERNAFHTIYNRYASMVYTLAVRLTGSTEHADDAVQEVFLRVWNKLGTFGFKSKFSTWLYRLALNVVLRKKNKIISEETAYSDTDVELVLARAECSENTTAIDLERALLKLPALQRQVFVLFVMEGFSHSEIMEIIGISEAASKTSLSRARENLRKELSK